MSGKEKKAFEHEVNTIIKRIEDKHKVEGLSKEEIGAIVNLLRALS